MLLETAGNPPISAKRCMSGALAKAPILRCRSGPSTVRDATGTVVDIVMNPVRLAVPKRELMAATAIKLYVLVTATGSRKT